MGAFRTQSLRNVAVTAPYMHDGSIATLEAVLDHYAAHGRALTNTAPCR
jgi:cytochrome c peroxidase